MCVLRSLSGALVASRACRIGSAGRQMVAFLDTRSLAVSQQHPFTIHKRRSYHLQRYSLSATYWTPPPRSFSGSPQLGHRTAMYPLRPPTPPLGHRPDSPPKPKPRPKPAYTGPLLPNGDRLPGGDPTSAWEAKRAEWLARRRPEGEAVSAKDPVFTERLVRLEDLLSGRKSVPSGAVAGGGERAGGGDQADEDEDSDEPDGGFAVNKTPKGGQSEGDLRRVGEVSSLILDWSLCYQRARRSPPVPPPPHAFT